MADHAAWKNEEARQAQIYAEAIDAAVKEASKQFETPIMNALCGALVTMQAAVLSAVEDPRARKALRKAMENELPRALALQVNRKAGFCQTVVVGGRVQ